MIWGGTRDKLTYINNAIYGWEGTGDGFNWKGFCNAFITFHSTKGIEINIYSRNIARRFVAKNSTCCEFAFVSPWKEGEKCQLCWRTAGKLGGNWKSWKKFQNQANQKHLKKNKVLFADVPEILHNRITQAESRKVQKVKTGHLPWVLKGNNPLVMGSLAKGEATKSFHYYFNPEINNQFQLKGNGGEGASCQLLALSKKNLYN